MRPRRRFASNKAVRPPIEWPMMWNLSIWKCVSRASAVETRKGMFVAERLVLVEWPQPGASNAMNPCFWSFG